MNRPWSQSESMADDKLAKTNPAERIILRLYIAGLTPRSTIAVEQIKALCEMHLAGRYELTIIDLFLEPEEARLAQIVVAPTLVKLKPEPMRIFVGDLMEEEKILRGLDVL